MYENFCAPKITCTGGNSKDTGPTYGICSVTVLLFHSFLKCFLHKERKLIYENVVWCVSSISAIEHYYHFTIRGLILFRHVHRFAECDC